MRGMNQECEEIRVYERIAERTGATLPLRGLRSLPNGCTSMRDLVRKYKLMGDGLFYLPTGHWPNEQPSVVLDNVKWIGIQASLEGERHLRVVPIPDDK